MEFGCLEPGQIDVWRIKAVKSQNCCYFFGDAALFQHTNCSTGITMAEDLRWRERSGVLITITKNGFDKVIKIKEEK